MEGKEEEESRMRLRREVKQELELE